MRRGRSLVSWVGWVGLVVLAVSGSPGCSSPPAPERFEPPADRSMSSQQLARLGLPATDQAWGVAEYERAVAVLRDIASVDPLRLPRHGSPRSGDAFARIVSSENLSVLRDGGVAASTRVEMGGALHEAIQGIVLVYLEPAERRVIFDEELVRAIGLYLQSSLMLWPLLESTLELSGDPVASAARRRALDEVRGSFGQVVIGACVALRDFSLRASARRTLIGQLTAAIPGLAPAMSTQARSEAAAVLGDVAQHESEPDLRADLDGLVAGL